MRNWKCKKCKKYKPIDYKKMDKGDSVFFYKEKIRARKIEKSIFTGKIYDLNQGVALIESAGELYECTIESVYPYWAPAKIAYDIFGKCEC